MSTPVSPNLLAAYGTLMRGQANFLEPAARPGLVYAGDCLIPGALHLVVSGACGAEFRHPALIARGNGLVRGELFTIGTRNVTASRVLAALDDYEETRPDDPDGSTFLRRRMAVWRADRSEQIEAWVYVYNRSVEGLPPIASGDWRLPDGSR